MDIDIIGFLKDGPKGTLAFRENFGIWPKKLCKQLVSWGTIIRYVDKKSRRVHWKLADDIKPNNFESDTDEIGKLTLDTINSLTKELNELEVKPGFDGDEIVEFSVVDKVDPNKTIEILDKARKSEIVENITVDYVWKGEIKQPSPMPISTPIKEEIKEEEKMPEGLSFRERRRYKKEHDL